MNNDVNPIKRGIAFINAIVSPWRKRLRLEIGKIVSLNSVERMDRGYVRGSKRKFIFRYR